LTVAIVVSCGDPSVGQPNSTQLTVPGQTAAPNPPSREPVRIAFAGDASFEGLGSAVEADPTGVLTAIAPVLRNADLTVVNLEAALGTAGSPVPKGFNFRVPAEVTITLSDAGVDVVSMANNHGLDYGQVGLSESLAIEEESGFPVIGAGRDAEEAYEPFVTEINGQRIGIIAASDVIDTELRSTWVATDSMPGIASAEEPEQERLAAEVAELRPNIDTLVVFLHYGVEKETCPNSRQRELVDLLVDAGADIVVGAHAHRLQGLGYLGQKFVAYGLGNFIFGAPSEAGRASGVLIVTATGRQIDDYEWIPARIDNGVPVPLTGDAAEAALNQMDERRECAGLTTSPSDTGGKP
jgi:poly-gamma-glutamate synthesis protein (capsule biosynthesis protein)